jgi:hypothetical protein
MLPSPLFTKNSMEDIRLVGYDKQLSTAYLLKKTENRAANIIGG